MSTQSASTQSAESRKWTLDYPELGTEPVPIESYLSPAHFELERERVFRPSWLCIGRVEDAPEPGDYFVKDIAACNASVLVSRGRDGTLRAFHNVCAHRCNKLVFERCGTAQGWSCHYHGWAYDSKGQLRSVPDEEMFYNLDKRQHGLAPVALDIWGGFIFINLSPQPKESLVEFLGELGEQYKNFPFHEMTQACAYRVELTTNWKIPIDASSEVYHLPLLHRNSGGDVFTKKTQPAARPIDVKLWDRHRYYGIGINTEYRPSPVAMAAAIQALTQPAGQLAQLPTWLNPTRAPNWVSDTAVFFPNYIVAMQADSYLCTTSWPVSVDRTIWEMRLFMKPAQTPGQVFAREYNAGMLRTLWMEDALCAEGCYAGMKTQAKPHMLLHDGEVLTRHFHKVVNDHVR